MSSNTNASTPTAASPQLLSEQRIIQQEWANAGKPHNFICSTCHRPGNLRDCSTCCRAYHVACLPAPPAEEGAGSSWSCPVCRRRQEMAVASRLTEVNVVSPAPLLPLAPPPPTQQAEVADQLSCEHAKQLLARHGIVPASHDGFSPAFLRQLQQLIVQAEIQSQTARELEQLRNENQQLREENHRLKNSQRASSTEDRFVYDRLRSPPVLRGFGSEAVEADRLDVAEKSWDRIISEAF